MQDTSTLEQLQNEAARIVTGLTRSVSLVNLYRECGWVPLHTRRKEQKLAFMYKVVNDLTPEYISDLIPHSVRDVTNYSLRNNNNLRVPFTRTEISCIYTEISPVSHHLYLYETHLIKKSVHLAVCHALKIRLKIFAQTVIMFHIYFYVGKAIGQFCRPESETIVVT